MFSPMRGCHPISLLWHVIVYAFMALQGVIELSLTEIH